MRITAVEFEELMAAKVNNYTDFDNWDSRKNLMKKAQGIVQRMLGRRINVYS